MAMCSHSLLTSNEPAAPVPMARLCGWRARLVSRYGRAATRRYSGMIYFVLLKSVVGRRLPVIARMTRRLAMRSTLLTFLTRGPEALPPASLQNHGEAHP